MTAARLLLAALVSAAALAVPGIAGAEEASGCDAFRWPLEKERAALVADGKPVVANGGALAYGTAATLTLAPAAEAGLPRPPSRPPKFEGTHAGHFTLPAPPKPGVYAVTIAANGWIDVIDADGFLHPRAFTAARDCEGARKSVKFALPGRPLDIELSGVTASRIAVIVTEE